MHSNQYKTKWAKEPKPYGAFEDYIIFKANDLSFVMHESEFDWIANKLFDLHFLEKKTKYIQILKEWNEVSGFYDIKEKPSIILDIKDTLNALSFISIEGNKSFGEPIRDDFNNLVKFLTENKKTKIIVEKK